MSKTKSGSDVRILKGQEAEDKVLAYIKQMNRPYGAADVAANLKGAVPKTAMQKILVALAEKGELTQKPYGKTTFFVANQVKIESVPASKLQELESEYTAIEEENKASMAEIKALQAELNKLKTTPTTSQLSAQIKDIHAAIDLASARLVPLRSGGLVSADDLAHIDADWIKWRPEWVRRKRVFTTLWQLATDALPPQDATALAEDLGIEFDTPEHASLEHDPICAQVSLKRKR